MLTVLLHLKLTCMLSWAIVALGFHREFGSGAILGQARAGGRQLHNLEVDSRSAEDCLEAFTILHRKGREDFFS